MKGVIHKRAEARRDLVEIYVRYAREAGVRVADRLHAEAELETMLRLDSELERLGEVSPSELADIAWRIDSPELHAIAVRLEGAIERKGRKFE